jgi:hypothetical protein
MRTGQCGILRRRRVELVEKEMVLEVEERPARGGRNRRDHSILSIFPKRETNTAFR